LICSHLANIDEFILDQTMTHHRSHLRAHGRLLAPGALIAVIGAMASPAVAQVAAPVSLKTLDVPEPDNLDILYVKDRQMAIVLGKAFFWDSQVGSDGVQACATCHYKAGVDARSKNSINPGPDGLFQMVEKAGKKMNPLSFLLPQDQSVDDVIGSQGVKSTTFEGIQPGSAVDNGTALNDPTFGHKRRVTDRQAPSVINAVFNQRNFWDGRAQNIFNGRDTSGWRNPNARVFYSLPDGTIFPVTLSINNASLASQAVGPVNNGTEMAFHGRSFPELCVKLTSLDRPLQDQRIDPTDSTLGPYVHESGKGLTISYADLIKAAFHDTWWNSSATFNANCEQDPNGQYDLMACNFSLFWGLAIQMYESTLVSDDSPFDRWAEGDTTALTAQQMRGMELFNGPGRCVQCHMGTEFSAASVRATTLGQQNVFNGNLEFNVGPDAMGGGLIEIMLGGHGGLKFYDLGYYNIGVRPTAEDIGIGGLEQNGLPLSFTRLAQSGILNLGGTQLCGLTANCAVNTASDVAVDGAFKVPSLRNVELTGPYFHTGRYPTLESVMDFYQRAGDRTINPDGSGDSTGSGPPGENGQPTGSNLAEAVHTIGLDGQEQADVVAFMKSLTDERVRWEMAPFDHPALELPHAKNLKAVGMAGRAAQNLAPLEAFWPGKEKHDGDDH